MNKVMGIIKTGVIFIIVLLLGSSVWGQTVIISEVTDPGDTYQARFVEIYNATNSSVDLSGWEIRRYTNGSTSSSNVSLSGTLSSGDTYVVAYAETDFNTAYGFNPDISHGYISGNGDDVYELYNGSNVVDIYGEVGVDGTGKAWEYEDSRAVRNQSVCSGNTTWTSSEWTITSADVADMDPDNHICDCPTSGPTITLSESSLPGFSYEEGSGPSAEQSFTVEGSNLTDDIILSAPTNYEISETSGNGFGNSVTLTQSGGTVSTTTIYVRLKAGLSIGTYNNEDITASSTDATDQTVTCDGEVVCPSVSAPTATAATSTTGTGFTANWDAVSGATGYDLDVYSSGSAGSELVVNGGFESGDNTGWTTFEAEYQVVENDGTVTPHSGSYMLKCFANGTRDLAQDITITADGSTQYEISFWYRYESAFDPEKLRIWSNFTSGYTGDDLEPSTYLDATDTWTQVTYTVTPSAGSNTLNLELRSYSSGKIYLDDISFKTVGGGTTYHLQNEDVGNVTTYDVTGLTAGETYYYVVRAYNDCGSESANSNEITVNLACSDPTTEATNLSFPATQYDQMDVSWTAGDGENHLVVASTSPITGAPADNTSYAADANFGDGATLNAGEYVVYAGSGTSFTMTGLNSDTQYYIKVFEYNCDSGNEQYLTGSPLSGDETTVANIPAVTGFDVTCTTETTATVEWTNPSTGDWGGVIIAIRNSTNPVHTLSDDPTTVSADPVFGNGHEFGLSTPYSYVVYKGTGTSVTITGLTQGQEYSLKAISYYGSLIGDETTTTISSLEIAEVTAASATTENSQTNLSWSNPGACYDEILVVGHEGSSVTANPSGDSSAYAADGSFGAGTDIGTNEYVVYKGNSTSITVTNLTNGNSYYFTIFVRVGTEWSDGVEVIANPSEVTDFIPGDLAIIAVNTNHSTIGEEFTFVSFVDIAEGTAIDFTDNGWQQENPDSWGTTEGTMRLTRISGGTLPAGTSVTVIMNSGNGDDQPDFDVNVAGVDELGTNWSISLLNNSEGTGFNLNIDDEIWMMQGGSWIENDITSGDPINDDDEYTGYVLYGWTATGWGTGESTKKSDLYPACECFNTNVSGLDNQDKVKYTGPMTDATKLDWINRFNDETNWTGYVSDAVYDAEDPDYRNNGISIGILGGGFESGRWTASHNTDWFNCRNWQNLTIPDENTDVLVSTTIASDDAVVSSSDNALCRDITIESGIDLDFSSNTLEVHGDFLNQAASLTTANGTLLLAADEAVNITNNGVVMPNVTINGSGTFNLQDDLVLDGVLTLTNGVVSTGTNMLHVDNTDAAAITGHSAASYINGNLRRSVNGAGLFEFPVGDDSNYELAEVDINSASGLTHLDAHFASADLGPINIGGLGLVVDGTPLVSVLDAGYWQVEPNSGVSSLTYDIILNERGASNAAPVAAQHAVVKRDDAVSDWELQGSHDNATQAINGSVVTAQVSGLSGFSQFAIARSNQFPLAVELTDFDASCRNGNVLLAWTTASEENSDYFRIEYAADAKSWKTIEKVLAFSTTNQQQDYQLLLEDVPTKGYFRLSEVDTDGTVTSYKPAYINCRNSEQAEFTLAPNPAAISTKLKAQNASAGFYLVRINDMQGRLVQTMSWENPAEQCLNLNLQTLQSGVYSVLIYNESEASRLKLVVSK